MLVVDLRLEGIRMFFHCADLIILPNTISLGLQSSRDNVQYVFGVCPCLPP